VRLTNQDEEKIREEGKGGVVEAEAAARSTRSADGERGMKRNKKKEQREDNVGAKRRATNRKDQK